MMLSLYFVPYQEQEREDKFLRGADAPRFILRGRD